MEWWQIGLIILVSIGAGIFAGGLISYLVGRFVKKPEAIPWVRAKKEDELAAKEIAKREAREAKRAKEAEARAKKEAELAAKEIAKREAREAKEIAKREAEEAKRVIEAELEEQLKFIAADLLVEVKNNLRIATEPLTDKLLPFQTDVWDAHHYEANKLPANLRDVLEQAYTDIRLANSIVWVSTEFNRRSRNLDEHYQQLRISIMERLARIKPLIEQIGK